MGPRGLGQGARQVLALQRSIGNGATIAYLNRLRTGGSPTVQRKTLTDHKEKAAYRTVLGACTSISTSRGTQNVLPGIAGIPQPWQGKAQAAVVKMNTVNAALNTPGAGNNVWTDGGATADLVRTPHDNRDGWLANPTAYVPPAGASAAIAAWGAQFGERYIELTVDSSWRLVWDLNTNSVYLTLHYDNDGSHSPFFLITGLQF
jgi:hypothetical protein